MVSAVTVRAKEPPRRHTFLAPLHQRGYVLADHSHCRATYKKKGCSRRSLQSSQSQLLLAAILAAIRGPVKKQRLCHQARHARHHVHSTSRKWYSLPLFNSFLAHFNRIFAHTFTDSNNYLRVSPRDDRTSPSTHGRSRSVSVTPSVRSSNSRITVVDDYAELDDSQGGPGFYRKTTTEVHAPKYTWFEHFLGVLGFNVSKRKKPFVEVKKEKIMMPPGHEVKEVGHNQ